MNLFKIFYYNMGKVPRSLNKHDDIPVHVNLQNGSVPLSVVPVHVLPLEIPTT